MLTFVITVPAAVGDSVGSGPKDRRPKSNIRER